MFFEKIKALIYIVFDTLLRAVETIDFMTARWAHLPYESSGPEITCYKLANGETTCFSEREYEEWLDKYRN